MKFLVENISILLTTTYTDTIYKNYQNEHTFKQLLIIQNFIYDITIIFKIDI